MASLKRRDEVKRMEAGHDKLVSRMIISADGSTGLFQFSAWRGAGGQILMKDEEDAKSIARCEEQMQDWAKHCQCREEVQDAEDKPWRNEELKKLEKDMPRLLEKELGNAAKTHKEKTGAGCDGFHPRVQEKQEEKWWNSWRRETVSWVVCGTRVRSLVCQTTLTVTKRVKGAGSRKCLRLLKRHASHLQAMDATSFVRKNVETNFNP